MNNKRLPELNLDNRELEWARLRHWMDRRLEEFKKPPEGNPDSREYKRIVQVRANLEAMRNLDEDLHDAGIPVPFVGLHGCKVPYPEAIPVFLHHLCLPYNDDIKGSILRKLAVPYAGEDAFRAVHRALLSEASGSPTLLFEYGIALDAIGTKNQISELLAVARDRRLGAARHPVLTRLAKWRIPDAVEIARTFFDEENGEWLAINSLRLLRSWDDKLEVEKRLASPDSDVRAEARKFLKALDRATSISSSGKRSPGEPR
jgi:hypothetical protein